jgi:hypothetical protein
MMNGFSNAALLRVNLLFSFLHRILALATALRQPAFAVMLDAPLVHGRQLLLAVMNGDRRSLEVQNERA